MLLGLVHCISKDRNFDFGHSQRLISPKISFHLGVWFGFGPGGLLLGLGTKPDGIKSYQTTKKPIGGPRGQYKGYWLVPGEIIRFWGGFLGSKTPRKEFG